MLMHCCLCKNSIFYPTIGNYKCAKTGDWVSDVCNDFKPRKENEEMPISEDKENDIYDT